MATIGSYIYMLSPQRMNCSEGLGGVVFLMWVYPCWRKSGLGGPVSLSASCLKSRMSSFQSPFQHHVCLHVAVLLATIIMDYTSETVSKPSIKCFLL